MLISPITENRCCITLLNRSAISPLLEPNFCQKVNQPIDFCPPAQLPFSCDWLSTSVICFGICELEIRVTTASSKS
ncbi:hypothetical protein WR25_23481 [Diploscapter pachys]|uniref:Uncharacterized protein n=1 Tax=Diploscapter pachys TaxID=2018661 RepID=A0A2A2L952_9BILA|nr:hypothetical protein WR25_23481 [Diploscapter pachys]